MVAKSSCSLEMMAARANRGSPLPKSEVIAVSGEPKLSGNRGTRLPAQSLISDAILRAGRMLPSHHRV